MRIARRPSALAFFTMEATNKPGSRVPSSLSRFPKNAVLTLICVTLFAQGCRNLHHVETGWWRSAQPSPSWLYDFLKQEGIEVILNLRGNHPGRKDYDLELATANIFGTEVIGIDVSSRRQPSRDELLSILEFIEKHGDHKVLVHCRGGADRSALVIFLYLVERRGWSKQDARAKALSWFYGHFSCPILPWSAPAIDEFADSWVSAEWARKNYGIDAEAELQNEAGTASTKDTQSERTR